MKACLLFRSRLFLFLFSAVQKEPETGFFLSFPYLAFAASWWCFKTAAPKCVYSFQKDSQFQTFINSPLAWPGLAQVSWFLGVPAGSALVSGATAAAAGAPDSGDGD